MERLVKHLSNGKKVIFDTGKFDNWCVYIVEPNGNKMVPLDLQYFSELQKLSKFYEKKKLYDDFVRIYNLTYARVDESVLHLIDSICANYQTAHQDIIEQWLTVIYAGMIAEENKEHAILKKRIKHLGMYQVLVQNHTPFYAANFSKGKKWRELDALMTKLGI